MRKCILLLTLALALWTYYGDAQQKTYKFGYINSVEIFDAIPEKKVLDVEYQKYSDDLKAKLQKMYDDYQKKNHDFQMRKQNETLSEVDRMRHANDLRYADEKLNEFQLAVDQKVEQKRESLFNPLINRVKKAIGEVAKEGSYTYIFDSSTGSILHADASEDITPLILKKLNLTEK